MSESDNSVELLKRQSNPPPPPPPMSSLNPNDKPQVLVGVTSPAKCQNMKEDLRDFVRVFLKKLRMEKKTFIFNYRYLSPVLQDGPNCGLAALSMVTSINKESTPLEEIFNFAKEKGFSNNGEMFSVKYMAEIVRAFVECDVEILDNGLENQMYIVNEILRGGLLLIPYDADFNHSPCKRKGHRAHWAVVSGLVMEGMPPVESIGEKEDLDAYANSVHYLPNEGLFVLQYICRMYSPERIHLLARQGKSLHPQVWDYNDLRESNENLLEFDPSKEESDKDYVIPPEGVEGGLRGKALLIRGLNRVSIEQLMNYMRVFKSLM